MTGPGSKRSDIIKALLVLLFVSIATYFMVRVVFIYFAWYNVPEKLIALMFLGAEIFIMFHAYGYFIGVYRIFNKRGSDMEPAARSADLPPVAVLIPARHEPREVLENTLLTCYDMSYPNKKIYLLDDSSQEEFKAEAGEVAAKYSASVFRRTDRHGAKAGIINDCLKGLSEKYVAVFDADQNPMPDFLNILIPILEKDPTLAFVQTPQFYSNMGSSKISMSSNMQQAVFYEYICEGKSSSQAMICCGTNVVFRRKALADVGGLDESTVTEDFATSFKMHAKGWRSLYYNHVHTFGMGPEDLGSYLKQQNRWAMGNVGVLRKIIARFLTNPFSMSLIQWFEYFVTGSYYLIGWAYLVLVMCPVAYLIFGIPSFFMNPFVYTLTFVPYLVLSIAIFYTSMLGRYYKAKDMFRAQELAFISLPVYARASLFGLIGVKGTFQVTAKGKTNRISYFSLWPQITLWMICLVAITWGVNRFLYEQNAAVALNVLWTSYHFFLLSSIFYFNEEEQAELPCKTLKRWVNFEYKILGERHDIDSLSPETWRLSFRVPIKEALDKGGLIMCKLSTKKGERIVFDGVILEACRKSRLGVSRPRIGVVTISDEFRKKLEGVIRA